MSATPEQDKLKAWIEDQKTNHGLVDLHVTWGDSANNTTPEGRESMARAFNAMNDAIAEGRYTVPTNL